MAMLLIFTVLPIIPSTSRNALPLLCSLALSPSPSHVLLRVCQSLLLRPVPQPSSHVDERGRRGERRVRACSRECAMERAWQGLLVSTWDACSSPVGAGGMSRHVGASGVCPAATEGERALHAAELHVPCCVRARLGGEHLLLCTLCVSRSGCCCCARAA